LKLKPKTLTTGTWLWRGSSRFATFVKPSDDTKQNRVITGLNKTPAPATDNVVIGLALPSVLYRASQKEVTQKRSPKTRANALPITTLSVELSKRKQFCSELGYQPQPITVASLALRYPDNKVIGLSARAQLL
jgi:hypothetical protein